MKNKVTAGKRAAGVSTYTAMAIVMSFAMISPAHADVWATFGSEAMSWLATFNQSLFPVIITIGLLICALLFAVGQKTVAIGGVVSVVAGACIYGVRELIIALGA